MTIIKLIIAFVVLISITTTINMSNNSTRIEFGDYTRSPENRRPHIYTRSGRIETDGESTYIYGERGERSGDPINSNGDEDIPNLSAIYREWAKYLRASTAQSALDEAMLIEARLHYSTYTRAHTYACAMLAHATQNLTRRRGEKVQIFLCTLASSANCLIHEWLFHI